MNTAYKMEKSLLVAVLAVLAVSAVFVGAIVSESADAAKDVKDVYGSADLPQRSIDFDVTLGYDYYALSEVDPMANEAYPHTQYWVASFDFSNSINRGYYWPYGNDAVIAVTFYFSDGTADDIGNIKASKTVCYPVFEVNGIPYVEDVICTPDLWPSEDNVYPVQVEAVIYTTLYNDTALNGQYQLIIGTAFDFGAFEYVVEYRDALTNEMIAPEKYGWGSWAVDRNNSGYYIRNSYEATPGPSGYSGGFRVYAGEIAGYSIYSVDDITGDVIKYKYKTDDEGRYYQPVSIVTPDKTPQELLGLTYQELVWSVGGKSAADIQAGQGKPYITDEMMEAYFEGISPYNVTTFYYYPEVTVTVVTEGEKGTVSETYFKVAYGTVLSTAGDTLTVGDYGTSVATAAPADAQYTYEFINFTEGDVVVTSDWVVTAHFRPIVNCYTVYVVTEGEKGSVSVAQFDNVPYGTEITYVDNVLSLSDRATTSVATAAPADAQYTYGFVGWTEAPKTVTSDWTVTAHFAPVVNCYTVYFKAIGEKGTVSIDKIENVPYGTKLSDLGTKFTVAGMGTCDAIVAPADAQYTYQFVEWQAYPDTVVADTTIVAVFSPIVNNYTVYFEAIGQKGTVSIDKITDVPYGTSLSAVGTMFTVAGKGTCNAIVADADAQYTYRFVEWQEYPATVVKDTYIVAVFEPVINQYVVTVVTEGEKGTVDVDRYVVDYGTKLSTAGNILTVTGYGQTVATPAPADQRYTYSFINYTEGDTVIVSDWVVTAHFKPTAIPYSVVIKYVCDGAPILKDGVDIRVNSQGEWGSTFTYNYLDNPKFDSVMASKYTLLKGYVEQPPMLADQGETVSVVINENLTVIVFDFSKKGAYVQFHRQTNPVANPVYETPEPYGDAHHATIAANDPTDAGKAIKILITDNVIGNEAQGTFIGAGQSATYNGYTYSVNQLPKVIKEGLTFDAVEVVIAGGLNVHDDINDPLVIWYQMI